MTQTIRKMEWSSESTVAYEIRKTNKYINLEEYTNIQGHYNTVYRLPLSAEAELVEAYDNGEMDSWMFRNIDENTPVVRKERIF